ncbi:hypothetical protein B0T25DRAFT_246916 [Lasiosphaeria hispida]|uniref:Uncharacterized protein n=1 Tax=Lasiosphaeria hispida TaxID=260671 RepID=A0AAJ0HEZ2_9PEZI|nr:hypothetical protein B0T25DRAFT_246916 [Lasiosphaeria hispida]
MYFHLPRSQPHPPPSITTNKTPVWRLMLPTDIPRILPISQAIHTSLPKAPPSSPSAPASFPRLSRPRHRRALQPGSRSDSRVCGYAISHPIRRHQPPALDTLVGEIAPGADQYYIHDVAVLLEVRGRGAAREGLRGCCGLLLVGGGRWLGWCRCMARPGSGGGLGLRRSGGLELVVVI